jgi:hypothetical protein
MVNECLRGLVGAKFFGSRDTGKWSKVTVWKRSMSPEKPKFPSVLRSLQRHLSA